MRLQMTKEAVDYAVKRTDDFVVGQANGTRYSGDHLNALCRSIARLRLRDAIGGETDIKLVERALTEWVERPKMTDSELRVLATHEAGHAVVSMFCDHSPPIDRITIESEMQWSFGYVRFADPAHKYIRTVGFYLDQIAVSLGAREAEHLLLDDISMGATQDLASATAIARELVESQGLAGGRLSVVQFYDPQSGKRRDSLSQEILGEIDARVAETVELQRKRAEKIVRENKALIETLRDMLLSHKTIDSQTLKTLIPKSERTPAKVEAKQLAELAAAPSGDLK